MFFDLRYRLMILLTLALLLTAPLSAGWLDRAISAYNAGNYQEAIRILQPEADAGDAEANYYLGQIYRMGRGVEPDNALAKQFYLEAASQGHVDAQRNLGSLYFFEAEESTDNPDAVKWLTRAAETGDAWSQWFLGKMYINGQGVGQDSEMAYQWFEAAGKQNHQQAKEAAAEIRKQRSQAPEAITEETTGQTVVQTPEAVAGEAYSRGPAEAPAAAALPDSPVLPAAGEPVQSFSAGYMVQLAAFTSRKNAERGRSLLQASLGELLDEKPLAIHEVKNASTQSAYKLLIAPFDKAAGAVALCAKIKDRGQDCFVTRSTP